MFIRQRNAVVVAQNVPVKSCILPYRCIRCRVKLLVPPLNVLQGAVAAASPRKAAVGGRADLENGLFLRVGLCARGAELHGDETPSFLVQAKHTSSDLYSVALHALVLPFLVARSAVRQRTRRLVEAFLVQQAGVAAMAAQYV